MSEGAATGQSEVRYASERLITEKATMREPDQTLRIDHVVGSCHDPVFHGRVHALEHRSAVDVVTLQADDLARRRILTKTQSGLQVAIALPREERLFDGAILFLDETRAVVVRAEAERWLRLRPRTLSDAIELGYQAGNLHWRVRFEGDVLLVPLDGPPEDYVARLGKLVSAGRVAVDVVAASDPRASGHS